MNALVAEMTKLRRSRVWWVVVLLPVLLVLAGAATKIARGTPPAHGWDTVWLQSVGFYGLLPLALGTAILGSLVWGVEHRGSAWNALMSGPTTSSRIVLAKGTVVAGLVAVMQIVLVVAVVVVGKAGFHLHGMLPARYLVVAALLAVAAVPLGFLQSALSMLVRSFAGPVAIALVGTGVSVAALVAVGDLALVSPYALATRAALLGTGQLADPGSVSVGQVATIAGASAVLTGAVAALTALVLDHRDTRA